MQKNDLIRHNGSIFRVLAIQNGNMLVMDCIKRSMPQWYSSEIFKNAEFCTEQELFERTDIALFDIESLDPATKKTIHERFTLVAGVLPFIADEKMRAFAIQTIAEERNVSKQTIRNYLCLFLA